jgi:hypothetical protein
MATRLPIMPREVSIFDSLAAAIAYEQHEGLIDETSWGADPFDILADREERAGMPLIDMPDDND